MFTMKNSLSPMLCMMGARPRMMFSTHLYKAGAGDQNNFGQANLDSDYLDHVLSLSTDKKEDSAVEYTMPFNFEDESDITLDLKGRNSKTPKKSNHGARPCSSVMRKLKKLGWFKKITSTK